MYAFPFYLADLVSCGKPPPVPNAQDWYQFTSIGINVTYVCNPGYTLFGPTRRTCKANGRWDGVKPYCCTLWSKYLFPQSIIFFLSLIILPILRFKWESFSGIASRRVKKNSQTCSSWSCQAKGQIILFFSPFSLCSTASPHAFYKLRNRLHGDLGRGPFICSAARLQAKQAPKLLIVSNVPLFQVRTVYCYQAHDQTSCFLPRNLHNTLFTFMDTHHKHFARVLHLSQRHLSRIVESVKPFSTNRGGR